MNLGKEMSRRQFLRIAGLGASSLAIAACAPISGPPSSEVTRPTHTLVPTSAPPALASEFIRPEESEKFIEQVASFEHGIPQGEIENRINAIHASFRLDPESYQLSRSRIEGANTLPPPDIDVSWNFLRQTEEGSMALVMSQTDPFNVEPPKAFLLGKMIATPQDYQHTTPLYKFGQSGFDLVARPLPANMQPDLTSLRDSVVMRQPGFPHEYDPKIDSITHQITSVTIAQLQEGKWQPVIGVSHPETRKLDVSTFGSGEDISQLSLQMYESSFVDAFSRYEPREIIPGIVASAYQQPQALWQIYR